MMPFVASGLYTSSGANTSKFSLFCPLSSVQYDPAQHLGLETGCGFFTGWRFDPPAA